MARRKPYVYRNPCVDCGKIRNSTALRCGRCGALYRWRTNPRPPVREFQVYRGITYYLDGQGYYRSSRKHGSLALHRQIWTDAYGPIPDGHHIHHLEHDSTNNKLSNLDCMSAGEHAGHHYSSKAAVLHGQQARQKLSETKKQQWAERPAVEYTCEECGKHYLLKHFRKRNRFCSPQCNSRWWNKERERRRKKRNMDASGS